MTTHQTTFHTLLLVLLLGCTVSSLSLFAQGELDPENPLVPSSKRTKILVGPIIGYNGTSHSGSFQSISGDDRCPNFSTGSNPGFYAGLTYEMQLGEEVANSKSSIIFRGMYESMPAFFEVPGAPYPSRLPDGTEVVSTTRHTTDIKYNMATLEAVYKLNLFGSMFGFTVGPSVSIPISSSVEQRFELLQPNNVKFEQDPNIPAERYLNFDRTIVTSPLGDIKELNPFRFAIKFGVHYEFLVARTLVVPHLGYNFGVTTTSSVDGVRINALQGGVEVRFAL